MVEKLLYRYIKWCSIIELYENNTISERQAKGKLTDQREKRLTENCKNK